MTNYHRRLSIPSSGSLRRRIRERRQAEQARREGEKLARDQAEYRARQKIYHQLQAREQLETYEPWGRAGGGAPNARGVRFTNIRQRGIIPEDELRGVNSFEASRRWTSPPRRHRRTPRSLRLREDPQLLYADNLRQSVDNDIRYRRTSRQQQDYKEILDDMVLKRQQAIHDEIRKNLACERKMHKMDSPWGKPGPGGTTWRNPRDIGLNFSESMGWTDNEMLNKIKEDHQAYLKNSSLTLPKVKYDLRHQDYATGALDKENYAPEKLPTINTPYSPKAKKENVTTSKDLRQDNYAGGKDLLRDNYGGGRDLRQDNYASGAKNGQENRGDGKDLRQDIYGGGNLKLENYGASKEHRPDIYETNNLKQNIYGKDIRPDNYPGRVGERQVNFSANKGVRHVPSYQTKNRRSPVKRSKFDFRKLPTGEDIRCIVPDDYYNNCPDMADVTNYGMAKRPTPEEAILNVTGGVELVPLMARRRQLGARTLPSSDVTRPPEQSCEWRERLDGEHLKILKHQMRVKSQQKEQKRLNSAEEIRQHHATWASLWGRPGHGAPQQRGRYARSNLAQLLYSNPISDYTNAL